MAEEKQIGIPQESVDYSSDLITKPYELDANKHYDDTKYDVIGGEITRTVVDDKWSIKSEPVQRRPQAVQAISGVESSISDLIDTFGAKEYIKWKTDPAGAAGGWGLMMLPGVNIAAGGGAIMTRLEQNFPETFGRKSDFTVEKLQQTWDAEIQKQTEKLEKARADLSSGKIPQAQFDAIQKNFDNLVSRRQKSLEQVEKYNAAVKTLDGIPYPNKASADSAVLAAVQYVEARDLNKSIGMVQSGIDPESTGYKIGDMVGVTGMLVGSGALANYLARYGLRGGLQRLATDVEAKGAIEKLATIKPIRSRRQAAQVGKAAVELSTEELESTQYVWQNIQDYIERTGDTTLSEFTPRDAKGLFASAYGAIAGRIETMGGIENIAAGAFRRLGIGGFWRRTLSTGGEEWFEEGVQQFSEFLTRKIDGTTDKTWGEALRDSLNAASWGGGMGIAFGSIGGVTYRNARKNGINVLQKYGYSRATAEKIFDNMVEQVAEANSPKTKAVRENIRQKVAFVYEGKGLSGAELEDAIEVSTDLELAAIATDAQERNIDIADHPLVLNGVVNEIGWFRDGIPEQVADQVAALNDEIAGLRQQLNEENAKEKKDYNKIEDLEAKIEQFYAKLPKEISNLVETDRQKVRQMLAEQSAELQTRQARRKLVRQVQQRAMNALQKAEESDVQQALRRLEQESKTEEKKAKEAERKQRTEQRKLRKAIEKVRQNIAKRKVGLPVAETLFEDADLVYKALKDSGFTDQQIAQMAEEDIVKTVAPYGIVPVAEQFSLADENARLDDIYPAYEGETIEVDGKERTVYNSDGNRIAKSAEALRNFWRWFGDSKVVDEQGRPLVVYHGTDAEFDTFDIKKSNNGVYGKGFYFAYDERIPKRHGNIVMPVYLKIENPFMASGKTTVKEIREKLKSDKYDGFLSSDEVFVKKNTQIKSVNNIGTYSEKTGNIYYQSSVTGRGADVVRGAYFPTLRLVMLTQNADATSLSHELAHDWMQQFFRWYRSGQASESFMQSWGALEKALGISPDDITVPDKASEAFARAYEAWAMSKTDWEKGIDIDDENRDKIVELFKRYQGYLTDIYEDLNNPYFLETWGETGKLKPELQAWFDRVTLQPDLIAAQVASGAITPQQAQAKIMARNVNDVVLAAEENFTEKEKEEIAAVERMNDTSRYEVKGGNKNSLQNRLSGLARDIDDNNIALGRYETHRDMLEVAKAADEFVRTHRDEALAIVNGLQPETEGLYASDLYTALERVARETNDVDLAMELVNSKVAKDLAKEWGQRIAGFRNFTGDGDFDVVSQLKSLDNQFKKDYDEKGKERVKTAVDEYVKELEKADSEQDVDSFLDSVKCQ